MPYQKTQDTDSQQSAGGQKQIVYFNSITAMPAYVSKSVEELRAEDYAVRFSNRREGSFCVLLFVFGCFSQCPSLLFRGLHGMLLWLVQPPVTPRGIA